MISASSELPEKELADTLLCEVLRGKAVSWPEAKAPGLEAAFLARAREHGVQSLVYDRLGQGGGFEDWPSSIKKQLLAAVRGSIAVDLLRSQEEARLLAALRDQGIHALLTKGAALSRTGYSASWLRARSDTDLFIDVSDIAKAVSLLKELGYKITGPIYKSHQFTVTKRLRKGFAATFDVHWRILNAPRFARVIGYGEALGESVPVPEMAGVRTLSPVHALLLACMHRKGSDTHDENRLIWLYDIHLLVSDMAPDDLARFARIAVEKNVQAACRDGVLWAVERFHTAIPGEVLEILSTAELRETLARRFANSYLRLVVDDLRCLPDVKSRLCLIGELLFPEAEYLLRKYGKSNRALVPWLWMRQVVSGTLKRLALR